MGKSIRRRIPNNLYKAVRVGARVLVSYVVLYLVFGSKMYHFWAAFVEVFVPGGYELEWFNVMRWIVDQRLSFAFRLTKHTRYRISLFHPARLLHAYLIGVLLVACWEIVHALFEIFLTRVCSRLFDAFCLALVSNLIDCLDRWTRYLRIFPLKHSCQG